MTKYEDIKKTICDEYLVTAGLLHYFAGRMAKKRGGHIVVVGSYNGITTGLPGFSLASSNQHALWSLCETVRDELTAVNVRLSYFATLRYNDKQNKKEYLTPKIEILFPSKSRAIQAEVLMNGILNLYLIYIPTFCVDKI